MCMCATHPDAVTRADESLARQYELRERAVASGWPAHQVVVIDADLGRSGAQTDGRHGFKELVADVGLGGGIVLGIEVSRLARNNAGINCWTCCDNRAR